MATSNDAISHIPATGPIRISDVNVLKRLLTKNTRYDDKDSSLTALRGYFKDYVGPRGDQGRTNHESTSNNDNNISLGRFRDNYIYGFNIIATSESRDDKYHDNNDASLTITGLYGKESVYSFTFNNSTKTPVAFAKWDRISGSAASGTTSTSYAASIRHRGSESINDSIGFTVSIGYANTPSKIIRNVNSDGINDNIDSLQSYLVGTKLYRLSDAIVDYDVVPSKVAGLSATPQSASSITLDWGVVGNALKYEIYRNNVNIGETTNNTYTDNGLASLTSYSYRVSAANAKGEGTKSDAVSASTLGIVTRFTFENRMVRNSLGTAISQDAIILDSYTNFIYKFRLRLNMTRYNTNNTTQSFSTEGWYFSRKYNTTNIPDRISYKNFSGIDQVMTGNFEVLESYDILRVEILNRSTGVLVDTVGIGKRISVVGNNNNGLTITNTPAGGGSFTASFEGVSEDYTSVNNIAANTLTFDLGLNQSPALREDWSISANAGATSVNEGSSITFNTLAYNPSGTYYWKINGVGTNPIEDADFSSTSGILATTNLSNGTSSVTLTPISDSLTEGNETFNVSIHKGSANGTLMATSGNITIGDTSQSNITHVAEFDFGRQSTSTGDDSGGSNDTRIDVIGNTVNSNYSYTFYGRVFTRSSGGGISYDNFNGGDFNNPTVSTLEYNQSTTWGGGYHPNSLDLYFRWTMPDGFDITYIRVRNKTTGAVQNIGIGKRIENDSLTNIASGVPGTDATGTLISSRAVGEWWQWKVNLTLIITI
jgi:hypothetical protein